jgi:hypothetical protein
MSKDRPYRKYDFIRGGKIIHSGITKDLERREGELKQRFSGGHIKPVGGSVTEESAREWETGKRKA